MEKKVCAICVKKVTGFEGLAVLNKTVKGDLGLNEEPTAPLKFSNIYPPHFLVFYYLSQPLPIIGIPNPTAQKQYTRLRKTAQKLSGQ